MITIKDFTISQVLIDTAPKTELPKTFIFLEDSQKLPKLVNLLRNVGQDLYIAQQNLHVPDGCEEYGFIQGRHALGRLLYFIADMLEE